MYNCKNICEVYAMKIIVIGAGAGGCMAAIKAAESGADVLLIEKNEKIGRKLMISGKGRCNVTNNCTMLNELIENVPTNGRFLHSSFSNFMPIDTMDFFEGEGVELKIERGNRVFPVSDKASDIVDALQRKLNKLKVMRVCGCVRSLIIEDETAKGVVLDDGEEVFGDAVVIATGGVSYPGTGSTGDGYELAKQAGHEIIPLKPSLVPLECHEGFCSELQGLSLRNVSITVRDSETYKEVYADFGEMLFTHFGVSGPIILSASCHLKDIKPKKYEIHIDLKPALTYEQLDQRVIREFSETPNKNFINVLDRLLPKKLVPVVVKLSGIKPSTKVNQITREQRSRLVVLLKDLKLTVLGFRPIEEAIVTSGGVSTKEINPKTMESKKCRRLFFAGEVVDVDAYTGGFNIQIAFSTGFTAGMWAAKQ